MEELAYVLLVFLFVFVLHKDIIKVGYACIVDVLLQDIVHIALEGSGHNAKAKGHHNAFIVSTSCLEGGFPLVSFTPADLV